MFWVSTASALPRAGAEGHWKRLLFERSLSVTSGSGQRAEPGIQLPRRSERTARDRDPPVDQSSVDFDRTREAYKSKDSLELLRNLVVFKLCSYDFLVDNNTEVMDLGKRILGQKRFDHLMKRTFYGQFVAGEDHVAIKPLIQKNQAFGVGSVLEYCVEEYISQK